MAKAKAGRGGPCAACKGGNCEGCLDSPENSAPVTLFTPKGAARAMLTGKILKDRHGWEFFWEDRGSDGIGFWFRDENGGIFVPRDFSGLYLEEITF